MSSSNSNSDGLVGTANSDNLEQGSGSPDLSSLAPASSNSGVASSSSSSSTAGTWFSRLTDLTNPYTWLAIVFIFALLGINIFMYLAQGTKDAAELFRPLFFMISKTVAFLSATLVGTAASGTKTIVTGATDVVDTGLTQIEKGADKVQEKTSPSNLQGTPLEKKLNDVQMDNNSLNKSLNMYKAGEGGNDDYKSDLSDSAIQSGGTGKAGWCYIGQDRGFRSCMKINKNDECMSGDIFPTKDICVNPNLRN